MSKKHHGGPAPIPPGNRSKGGPGSAPGDPDAAEPDNTADSPGATFQEQDPKRRLGGYGTAGEHPRQQPGPLNDGGERSR